MEIAILRYFGGSTNHWSGWCRTFEKEDFERGYLGKEYIWPITERDLEKFKNPACEILEINSYFNDNSETTSNIQNIGCSPVRFRKNFFKHLQEIQPYIFS